MIVKNIKTNTTPVVIHANGSSRKYPIWKFLKSNYKKLQIDNFNDDITIVTWNNNRDTTTLETQLNHLGIPHYNLTKNEKEFYWFRKQESILENMDLIKTKYVLMLDAHDVLLNGDMDQLRNALEYYQCGVLHSAEAGYQRKTTKNAGMQHIYEQEYEKHKTHDPLTYLNAGASFALTEYCFDWLTGVLKTRDDLGLTDDQLCCRITYLKSRYSHVKIDTECKGLVTMKYIKDILEYHET